MKTPRIFIQLVVVGSIAIVGPTLTAIKQAQADGTRFHEYGARAGDPDEPSTIGLAAGDPDQPSLVRSISLVESGALRPSEQGILLRFGAWIHGLFRVAGR
jgi:hypothetical protein